MYKQYAFVVAIDNKIHIVIIACRLQLVYMRMMQSKFTQTNPKKSGGGGCADRGSAFVVSRRRNARYMYMTDGVAFFILNQPYLKNKTLILTLCGYDDCDFCRKNLITRVIYSEELNEENIRGRKNMYWSSMEIEIPNN